jgi:hypothetical protein
MSGYIGKIAAIVTANTSDFTSKLAGTKKELNAFSGSIQSTISAASNNATKSLNSIFTPLQKLTRALDAGMRAPLELVDILEVRKMQTLVSLSEGLAKPLAGATRQFEQLSQQAQANFLPALIRSQTAVKALQTQFEATGQASGTGFEQARRQIERTTQAVQRLAQAQQLASKTLTGNELQFRNPRLAQTLSAGAALSQQAAALPADRLQDGAIGRQTAALKQYQDAAVAAQARVENLRLTPNVDPAVLKAAESQLRNLIETAERAGQEISKVVNRDANVASANKQADLETSALAKREQGALRLDNQLAASAKQRQDAEQSALNKREQTALRLESQLAAAVKQREDAEQSALNKREQTALRLESQLAAAVKQREDAEQSALNKREQTALRLESQLAAAVKQREDAEQSALNKREQTALRLESQLAAAVKQREDAEQSALNKREQTALRLESQLAAAVKQREDAEQSALNKREQTALRLESQLAAAAQKRADDEISDVIRVEQARKRLAEQLADNDPRERVEQRQREEDRARRRREEELEVQRGDSRPLGDRLAEQGRRRVEGRTGDINLDATPPPGGGFSGQAQRDIDALATRVGAVRQQLETLPNSVRTRFVPALLEARDTLVALQNAPGATVAQIQNAADAVERLEQNAQRARSALNFQVQFGGGGLEGLNRQFDERALQGYAAQLQVLQQTLGRVSAEARGPALQSFAQLRDAIASAMDRGTLETAATREQIRGLIRDAVGATAAVAGIGQGALLRQVQRTGDVATGRFSNVGFAVNQLAFAVDDFFSVTGSAEQRIRAIGNNITQFGLIAGGTAGLIVGLAAVLTAQGVVALIRFANGGTTAEDQTKALNAALQNQKSLVDELANSFRSLADSLGTGLFTKARQELEDFQKDVREIVEQQRAARDDRVVGTSPRAFAERAQQERIDRELAAEPNLARRQALARQREEAREVEQRIAERLRNTPAPTGEQLRETVQGRIDFLSNPRFGRGPSPTLNLLRQSRDRLPGGEDREARAAQIAELEEILGVLKPVAAQTFLGFRTLGARIVENTVNILEQNLALIERELLAAIDDDANRGLASVRAASLELAESVASLEESVAERIIGASAALAEVQALGARLLSARDSLVEAKKITDVTARGAAVDAANREIEAVEESLAARQRELAAIASLTNSVLTFAKTIDRISTQLANTVASEARSSADQARRAANATQAAAARAFFPGGVPPAIQEDANVARRRRERTERAARTAEDRAAENEARNAELRDDFERDARRGGLGQGTQRLIEERDAIDAILRGDVAASEEQINQARRRREEIDRQLDRNFEDSPRGRESRDRADQADQAQARRDQREEDIRRGRELSQSPAEQAGRQLADDLRALQAQRDEALLAGGDKAALDRDLANDRRRIIEDSRRQQAPAIFALGDAVQNAVLQGPSRAALQATDVSTVEGASELNRLLRGDDAARDQDLAELQKQSAALEELVRIAREGGAVIAN